jgi:anti-sigma factor RsiW
MRTLACSDALSLLDAYHDGELPIDDQIAIDAHLGSCRACARRLGELRLLSLAVRESIGRHSAPSDDEAFTRAAVSRWKAERQAAFATRWSHLFDDWHFVYAGLGAIVATAASVVVMFAMMRLATDGRPE